MIATPDLHPGPDEVEVHPRMRRAVLTIARVEGRRLIRHPAVIVAVALAIVSTAPYLISNNLTHEHNVGWLLEVAAILISLVALLAANLGASRSGRDGSEELFRSAPLSPASRTVAHALAAGWLMALLALLLLAGDIAIRAAGKGSRSDAGVALFPMFELVQGPLILGLFALIGVAVARWFPTALAGLVAGVGIFVIVNVIGNAPEDATWLRLTPFDPSFVNDGGVLIALHITYLVGIGATVLAVGLVRHGWTRQVRALVAGGLAVAVITGALQLAA
jgi:hypothetical protein